MRTSFNSSVMHKVPIICRLCKYYEDPAEVEDHYRDRCGNLWIVVVYIGLCSVSTVQCSPAALKVGADGSIV